MAKTLDADLLDAVFQRVTLVDVKFQSDPEFRPKSLPRKSLTTGRPQTAEPPLTNGVHHHEVVEVEHHVHVEHAQERHPAENGVDSSSSSSEIEEAHHQEIHELSRAREHRSSIFQAPAPPEEFVLPEAPAESAMALASANDTDSTTAHHQDRNAHWMQSLASQSTASAQDSHEHQTITTTTTTTTTTATVDTHTPDTEIPSSITDELLDMVFSAITLEPPRLVASSHAEHIRIAAVPIYQVEDDGTQEEPAKNVKPWKTPERDQLLAELMRRQENKRLYVDDEELELEASTGESEEAHVEGGEHSKTTATVHGLHQIQVNVDATADEHESIERTVELSDEEDEEELAAHAASAGLSECHLHHQHVYDYRTSPHQQLSTDAIESPAVQSPESVALPPMSGLSEGPNYTAEVEGGEDPVSRTVESSPKHTSYEPSTQDLVRQEYGKGRVVAIRTLLKKQSSGRITLPPLDIQPAGQEEDGEEGEDADREHKQYAKTPHPAPRKSSSTDELLWPRRGSSHHSASSNNHHSVEQARDEENEAGYKTSVQQLRNKFSQRQQLLLEEKQAFRQLTGRAGNGSGGGGAMHRPDNLSNNPGAIDIEHHTVLTYSHDYQPYRSTGYPAAQVPVVRSRSVGLQVDTSGMKIADSTPKAPAGGAEKEAKVMIPTLPPVFTTYYSHWGGPASKWAAAKKQQSTQVNGTQEPPAGSLAALRKSLSSVPNSPGSPGSSPEAEATANGHVKQATADTNWANTVGNYPPPTATPPSSPSATLHRTGSPPPFTGNGSVSRSEKVTVVRNYGIPKSPQTVKDFYKVWGSKKSSEADVNAD